MRLAPAGLENDLQAELQHSDAQSAKLVALLSNTEVAWEDTLFIKMRALEDKVRQQSDATVTKKVSQYLQQIKDKNEEIVEVSEAKENIESKMRTKVNDGELRELQREHSRLIKEYEAIIKQKVNIFTQMLANLEQLQEGNAKAILNEEEIAEVKLQIEVWERDIYQKKRVEMDVHVDILNTHGLID